MKSKEELIVSEILETYDMSVSQEEYVSLLTLVLNDHDITADWICLQMKMFGYSFQEALVKYVVL